MTREEAIKVLNMVEAHGLADEAKRMAIEALEQEPKTGHWIMTSDYYTGAYGTIDYVKCSCCGEKSLEEGDFCPYCGADMRKPYKTESEGKE